MVSVFSTGRPGRRTRQRFFCCTAFLPRATCSVISSRNSQTGFISLLPDLPAFGQSDMPARRSLHCIHVREYANVIDRFAEVIGLFRFAFYVFDYGAPVGFRLAVRHPDRITAIISQNGNAYEEGLSDGWNPIRAYWQEPSQANRDALRSFLAADTTRWRPYTHGVPDASAISPDGYSLDNFYLSRPGADEIQLDLFGDYKSNIALYPTFQDYFRTHKPPFLAVWGKNDPFFLPRGNPQGVQTRHSRSHGSFVRHPATSRWRIRANLLQRASENFSGDFRFRAGIAGHRFPLFNKFVI